jgi:hypothetical protein
MLGSAQPGEAEAARRKLVEHLGHHRLSLTDVAQRLREAPRPPAPGGGEMGMERQLHIARVARQEAEFDVQRARQRVSALSQSLQEANIDAAQAMAGQARARAVASVGWLLAAVAGLWALSQHWRQPAPPPVSAAAPSIYPDPSGQVLRAAPGERFGTVLVQDLPIRLTPVDDGEIRAFLNRGTRVVLERQIRSPSGQSWLLIRSITGSGWVRGGDVLH